MFQRQSFAPAASPPCSTSAVTATAGPVAGPAAVAVVAGGGRVLDIRKACGKACQVSRSWDGFTRLNVNKIYCACVYIYIYIYICMYIYIERERDRESLID